AHDFGAKPDVVATGVGIASLSVPGSTLFNLNPTFLLGGILGVGSKPYLALSGTSMASPIVAGTVALMMEANPRLTPNLAKAIIEYTSQNYGYDPLTQGAGFLNTKGAVDLARFLNHPYAGQHYPASTAWSKTILWGNRRLVNGVIKPAGTAWAVSTVWGAVSDVLGDNIVWGTACSTAACDNIVWGSSDLDGDNIVWGTADSDANNIVWGTIAAGTTDNIVWGSSCGVECNNVVWGTECGDADCNNIVWGSSIADLTAHNIVWGTADLTADNIVWGSSTDGSVDNIVWGSSTDGTGDNIVWGSSSAADGVVFTDPTASVDPSSFELDSAYTVPPDPAGSAPAPAPTTTPTDPLVATDPTQTAAAITSTTTSIPSTTTIAGGF
ncbi:MAG TPA: S8 family serine peptidase, partial [Vicinamibacterales bacterium]